MPEDLEIFRTWLSNLGRAETTIHDKVRFAEHCERVLGGDVDPRNATIEHLDLLKLRMSHLREKTIAAYIRSWIEFVRAVSDGNNFQRGVPYCRSETFETDLENFRVWLIETGSRNRDVDNALKFARHCMKVIWAEMGDLTPDQVGVDQFEELSRIMMDEIKDNTRLRYLRALGSFISFMTGRNPWRELTVPDRQTNYLDYVYALTYGHVFEQELQLFIGTLSHRGYKNFTISDKVHSTMNCTRRLFESGWSGDLCDITPETIEYLRSIMDSLKESTVVTYLRDFGGFIEFITGSNPVRGAHLMWNNPGDLVERHFIFVDDWQKLLAHAEPDEYLILLLGATLGLRRMEIAGLRLDDFEDGCVTIRGKGHGPDGKKVRMQILPELQKAIDDYLPIRRQVIAMHGDHSNGHLLVRRFYYPGENLSPDNVGDIVSGLGKRAGVKVTTHSLRRLYATSLYDLGTDIDTLRRMMRHDNVSTTLRCYIASDPRRISDANKGLSDLLFYGRTPSAPSTTIPQCLSIS